MAEEKSGSAAGSGDTHGESAHDGVGSRASTSASEAFHAGRAARSSPDGDDGLGPSESPTVEQSGTSGNQTARSETSGNEASRTEVMSTSHRPAETPTAVAPTPAPQQTQATATRSGPSAIGVAMRKVLGLVATVVTIVGLLCAAVLVVFVVLRIVASNPDNAAAQAISAVADRLVGAFRDLFLVPDPVGLIVNYGLAALAWIVVTAFVARILRALGRAIP